MEENVKAYWTIELSCKCPECKKCIDLLENDDFWEGMPDTFEVLQYKDTWVYCSKCGYEFKEDFYY